jgi:hypothetical protein
MLRAALTYVDAGWPIVPGTTPYGSSRRRIRITGPTGPVWVGCSCDSQYCMAPAAHPIDPHWQQHQITKAADARWWWSARSATTLPNIVLVCGPAFHVWSMPRGIGARVLDTLPEKAAAMVPVAATPTGWWHLFCAPEATTPEQLPPVPAGFGVVHLGDGSAVTAPPSTRGALGHDMWLREPIPRQRLAPCSVIAPALHRFVETGTVRAHTRRGVHGVEPLQQAAG